MNVNKNQESVSWPSHALHELVTFDREHNDFPTTPSTEHINMAKLVNTYSRALFAESPVIDLGALLQAQADEWEEEQLLDDVANLFQAPLEEAEVAQPIESQVEEAPVAEVAQPVESQSQAPVAEVAQPAETQTEVSSVRSERAEPQANEQRIDSEIMKARAARPTGARRPPTNRRDLAGRATIVTLAEPTPKEEALAAAPVAAVPPVVAKRAQGKIAGLANALGGGIKIQLPGQGMPNRRAVPVSTTSCATEANQTNPNTPHTPPIGRA